ncbi:hypothetical protein [Glutamicibacter sp. NPDC087583]|uniref:hypothetical protein n=1 Tax=Glutamicibacter sp. NPDC087583 TaxID=3363995 RepID=UPI003830EEEA
MDDSKYLLEVLPLALVLSLAGLRNPDAPPGQSPESSQRMQFAARIARRIEAAESRETATAWLATANEELGGELPIKAIREGRFDDVEAAAERFVSGWAG